eukprot:TRINITY_DN18140_c0_g1_i1.p1 TRINITY_DN18140_c0_g1~~TRINITY_DN18140_c0_g1_i1.p1  ORF type:complete len:273 (+),score=51.68 TRINITY_DN18140_c0_g1_i1:67-885(+)
MPGLTRAQARAKSAKAKAREADLKSKIEAWCGSKLRAAIEANTSLIGDLTARVEAQEALSHQEQQRLDVSMESFQQQLEKLQREQAKPREIASEAERRANALEQELQQRSEVLRLAQENIQKQLAKLQKDVQSLSEHASNRFKSLELSTSDYPDTKNRLQRLRAEFEGYVRQEDQRAVYNKRLEFLVKDMEDRNWPWRPNMDRSSSPHYSLLRNASPASSEISSGVYQNGLAKTLLETASAGNSSKKQQLLPPHASAGSGLSAVRSRPVTAM